MWLDPVEIGEVMYNLLESAAKYAPAETEITLQAPETEARSGYRSATVAQACPRQRCRTCSIRSIALSMDGPDRKDSAWGWQSSKAWSKRTAGASLPRIARVAVRASAYACLWPHKPTRSTHGQCNRPVDQRNLNAEVHKRASVSCAPCTKAAPRFRARCPSPEQQPTS